MLINVKRGQNNFCSSVFYLFDHFKMLIIIDLNGFIYSIIDALLFLVS